MTAWIVSPNVRFVGPEGAPICEVLGDKPRRVRWARIIQHLPLILETLCHVGIDLEDLIGGEL